MLNEKTDRLPTSEACQGVKWGVPVDFADTSVVLRALGPLAYAKLDRVEASEIRCQQGKSCKVLLGGVLITGF